LRREDVSITISFKTLDGEWREYRGAHGEEPFLPPEEGNRKTNPAGCVNEQFEITNVTGTLHDLNAKQG
jgi:hypothetical protein